MGVAAQRKLKAENGEEGQEKADNLDGCRRENQPKKRSQGLVELSTISNGSTLESDRTWFRALLVSYRSIVPSRTSLSRFTKNCSLTVPQRLEETDQVCPCLPCFGAACSKFNRIRKVTVSFCRHHSPPLQSTLTEDILQRLPRRLPKNR